MDKKTLIYVLLIIFEFSFDVLCIVQLKGERNYHVFYRLIAGMSKADLQKLHLVKDPWKYHYITRVSSY